MKFLSLDFPQVFCGSRSSKARRSIRSTAEQLWKLRRQLEISRSWDVDSEAVKLGAPSVLKEIRQAADEKCSPVHRAQVLLTTFDLGTEFLGCSCNSL